MKKIAFFAAAATVLMTTSCSQDTILEQNSDEIAYGVSANNSSRATDVYCTNNLPGQFNVYAGVNNNIYINGDLIANEDGKWVNKSGVRYWPNDEVTFYGIYNNQNSWNWNGNSESNPTVENFVVPADVTKQEDLIYARKSQSRNDGQVALNFRHALSQIVYRAKNTNANLYVEISGVEIVNVKTTGTYKLPKVDTDVTYVNHEGSTDVVDNTTASRGTWATAADFGSYAVNFEPIAVKGDDNVVSLTSANDAGKEFSSNALLLIPVENEKWDTSVAAKNSTGSYFKLKAKIYNVAGETKNDSDICLWNDDIYIPVDITWEEGKKYIYTFVFGKGNGGFEPDPENPEPDPVLVPIDFTVTVDDFIVENGNNIDMDTTDLTKE